MGAIREMRVSAEITGKTLYVRRLTAGGSIQLTDDPALAEDMDRQRTPVAISRLMGEYDARNIQLS